MLSVAKKSNQSCALSVSASLYTDKKRQSRAAALFIHLALVLTGVYGSVFSFLTCFDLGLEYGGIAAFTAVFSIALTLLFSAPKKVIPLAVSITCSGFLIIVFALRYKIAAGFFNIANIYLFEARAAYREKPFVELISPETAAADTRVFVLFAAFFTALALAYGVTRRRSLFAAVPVTILPVELCLFFGFVPSYPAFIALIAAWAGIIALDFATPAADSAAAYKKASAQCGLAAAALMTLCFLGAMLYVRASGYERPENVTPIQDRLSDFAANTEYRANSMIDFSAFNPLRNTKTGAIDHGRLGQISQITFRNRTVLRVNMPKTANTVYFRGFVGSVYAGDSWKELPAAKLAELDIITRRFETPDLNTLLLDSYNLYYLPDTRLAPDTVPTYAFSVRNVGASRDYLYMPYYLSPDSAAEYDIVNHSYFGGGAINYSGHFYEPSNYYGYKMLLSVGWSAANPELSRDERSYMRFVYENYLDLPERFPAAEMIFGEEYLNFITAEEGGGKSTLTDAAVLGRKLYYIKRWLRNNCQYDLNAGKLPADRDFVDYFLTQTQRGSCSHFASSAVLLCRYAGIPARYVEGYVLKPGDFSPETEFGRSETVSIADTRGHAWAEVYINGFGWYPVEFTSGYGNVQTALTTPPPTEYSPVSASLPLEAQTSSDTLATELTEDERITLQTESAAQTDVYESGGDETVPPYASEGTDAAQNSPVVPETLDAEAGGIPIKLWHISAALGVILCALALPLRRVFILSKYQSNDGNSAALRVYGAFTRFAAALKLGGRGSLTYAEYAEKLGGASEYIPPNVARRVIGAALKASFDKEPVPAQEVEQIRAAVGDSVEKYYQSANRFKKFYFKYILCLL